MITREINQRAKEIHTNPHIILDGMTDSEFRDWLKENPTQFSQEQILDNLADVLLKYEMYRFYYIVLDELDKL